MASLGRNWKVHNFEIMKEENEWKWCSFHKIEQSRGNIRSLPLLTAWQTEEIYANGIWNTPWGRNHCLSSGPLPSFSSDWFMGLFSKMHSSPTWQKRENFFTQKKVVFARSLILSLAKFQRRLIYRVDLVASWLAWSRAPLLRPCQASYSFNSLPMWSYNNNVMTWLKRKDISAAAKGAYACLCQHNYLFSRFWGTSLNIREALVHIFYWDTWHTVT